MSGNQYLCRCFILCFFLVALLAVSFYFTYRPIAPRYYVAAFVLNSSAASFGLSVDNQNKKLGIYHDDLALALSFPSVSPNFSSSAVVPGFYQGHKKTATKTGSFAGGRGWAPPANRSEVLRVDLRTEVRFQAMAWRTRRRAVSVGAAVEVGANGTMTAEDWIRLRSGAPRAGFRRGGTGGAPLSWSILAVAFCGFAVIVF
ncbi:protein NDR1-like [Zingiber officinale]|uniref:Late embryogenesis abundant protein LEA-2 subgroup domain-containing protein n=1 Tax=Zingiber officinale TaxID=94328 RepID=A0A8J5KJN0_ZINOF|nr:protein NDR1-like [Zingiber officinale]KAG6482177.1 hypothetical protein ZIOFF_058808 [Zingiber officinale]